MIPNEHALFLFRFGEKRWIENLVQGELSFSCTGAFILQAKKTGNQIQGDLFEGVFARLKKDDHKITEMSNKLGKALEIIDDGDYTLLRRRSSRLKPIFCFYGYTAKEALNDAKIEKVGLNTLELNFDERLYSGFAEDSKLVSEPFRLTQVFLQPKPFIDKVKLAMQNNALEYTMKKVDYELFKNETFFIEPTDEYEELFYKFPDYHYQHETRICLKKMKFSNIFERYPINIGQFDEPDYKMTYVKIHIKYNAIIVERDT